MQKIEKNYFRDELLILRVSLAGAPAIFTGKYKHSLDDVWAVFTTIRLYTPGQRNPTVCNHININRQVLRHCYHLTELDHNRKFYIVGRPSTYMHHGEERGCIELAVDLPEMMFWKADQSAGSDAHAQAVADAVLSKLERRYSRPKRSG